MGLAAFAHRLSRGAIAVTFSRARAACLSAVLLIAVLIYLPLAHNYFCVDDFFNLIISAETHSPRDLLRPVFQHLGPLLRLYFFAVHRLFGLHYQAYFLCILSVHLLNTLLAYLLLRAVFGDAAALFAAPFYAWNPLFFEAINWQTNIGQMICLAFILLTLICLDAYWRSNCAATRALLLSILCCILSMFAFSIGLLTPVFALLFYYLVLKDPPRIEPRRDLKTLTGFFPAATAYVAHVLTRPRIGLASFFSFSPLLFKYLLATTVCVLLPAFLGIGPFHIESTPALLCCLLCALLALAPLLFWLRGELRGRIIIFAMLYLAMVYLLQGAARLHLFGFEITYWLRYQIFQVIGVVLIAAEFGRAIARRLGDTGRRVGAYTLIALQIVFLWRATVYINTQNLAYRARYRYDDVNRYVTNVRRSYAAATDAMRGGEVIVLGRNDIVPSYVMPDTLRPLNRQSRFLKLALPAGAPVRFTRGRPRHTIDEQGILTRAGD